MGLVGPRFAAAQNVCQQHGVIKTVRLEKYPALKGFITGFPSLLQHTGALVHRGWHSDSKRPSRSAD
jgi:hypothetical protein